MNVLVLGSGGREHAIAWKIAQSPQCDALFVAPGNAGTAQIATNVALSLSDFEAIRAFCVEKQIALLVVGPEAPLVEGIVDELSSLEGLAIIGPDAAAAQLEGSKDFAKQFMQKYQVPTAAYQSFGPEDLTQAQEFLHTLTPPYVLKADGLAAGKGVLIINDIEEAKTELAQMLDGKFGEASKKVVIEEFLDGLEFSVFALTDGQSYKILPVAKDYKRIGEGDTGLNTGGMGAVSPVSFVDAEMMRKVEEQIVAPTIRGIREEGFHYKGFVFFGLIEVKGEPKVIEYNVRMGDPETEVVMPRLESDLMQHLMATANGNLASEELKMTDDFVTTVMAVSEGYPESYQKGFAISGLEGLESEVIIPFHAGTKLADNQVLTNGGRVIALSGRGKTMEEALAQSYKAAKTICYNGIVYRKDIGFDL